MFIKAGYRNKQSKLKKSEADAAIDLSLEKVSLAATGQLKLKVPIIAS